MGKIVQLPVRPSRKFGLEKVKARRHKSRKPDHNPAQLDLFDQTYFEAEAKVINFPTTRSFFEEALLLDGKRDQEARILYEQAIKSGDCVADAYCNLGILESQNGNSIGAIDCFTKSLKSDPRHFEGHYNLANIYSDVGNYDLAHTHYKVASEIEPGFPNVYFNLALVCALKEDLLVATSNLERYLELIPGKDLEAEELLLSLQRSSGS